MNSQRLYLFWTSTDDHHEDDFVVAATAREASEFHENYVGYDPGDAKSERLEPVRKTKIGAPTYASHSTLVGLGYKALSKTRPVIFAKHGRVFAPVNICYRLFLRATRGKKGIYVIRALGTTQFKIGLTANLEARLAKLQTGSPFRLHAKIFVSCERPKHLESAFHTLLRDKRESQEWFRLSTKEYRELRLTIWGLTRLSSEYEILDYDCYPKCLGAG